MDLANTVLATTSLYGSGSLSPLWDGLGAVPATLLLATVAGGAALTLQKYRGSLSEEKTLKPQIWFC